MTKVTKEFLINLVGKTIEFSDLITQWETYAEPGMKAKVTKWKFEDDSEFPVHTVWVDFSEFEFENHKRQEANYYDKAGIPCLTAVEAGYYGPVESLYIDENIEQLPFKVI